MLQLAIKEDLLHYIWQLKRFDQLDLKTTDGDLIEIIHFGYPNIDAGPDFLEATIKRNGTLWYGQIEIHVKSSDWMAHQHQTDPRYNNVILHVVYEADQEILDHNKQVIPCLVLKNRIDPSIIKKYHQLQASTYIIPCEKLLPLINNDRIPILLESLLASRFEERSKVHQTILEALNGDWEAMFYRLLSRAMGLRVNGQAFEKLTSILPLKLLHKNRENIVQLEALFFGQAGFLLAEPQDAYTQSIRREYQFLQKKYRLKAMDSIHWKFSRMRPSAFPSIRLAQLAAIYHEHASLFYQVKEARDVNDISRLFLVSASKYWDTHYRLGVPSPKESKKSLGRAKIEVLLINAVVPILFLFGKLYNEYAYCEKAIHFMSQISPELNHLTRQMATLGFPNQHAGHSQALIELKKNFCQAKRCLSCSIGHQILKLKPSI